MPQETFATLLNRKLLVPSRNAGFLIIERHFLVSLLAPRIAEVYVDEDWYLEHSPDVAAGIDRGDFTSAADHYANVGYFEHRMPYPIEVDDPWYLESYADIADAVKQGVFPNGKSHYYKDGFREGRFPHANFTLKSRADKT